MFSKMIATNPIGRENKSECYIVSIKPIHGTSPTQAAIWLAVVIGAIQYYNTLNQWSIQSCLQRIWVTSYWKQIFKPTNVCIRFPIDGLLN